MSSDNISYPVESLSLHSITDMCLRKLERIRELTQQAARLLDLENVEQIESVFELRGIEIEALSDLEKQLGTLVQAADSVTREKILGNYTVKRKELFDTVLEQNVQLDTTIRSMRKTVLNEIKNLERGKKMHRNILNSSAMGSGFIDITE